MDAINGIFSTNVKLFVPMATHIKLRMMAIIYRNKNLNE